MKVEILKDHESGLKEGQVKDLNVRDARHLVELGIGKLVDEKAPEVKPKKVKKEK